MTGLEQHHIRYLEIHGEDEIIMLSPEEHKKVHAQDQANGFKPIPKWIVQAAYNRSPVGKATQKQLNQTKERKATYRKYKQSEKGKAAKKRYQQSEKGKATQAARYRVKQKERI